METMFQGKGEEDKSGTELQNLTPHEILKKLLIAGGGGSRGGKGRSRASTRKQSEAGDKSKGSHRSLPIQGTSAGRAGALTMVARESAAAACSFVVYRKFCDALLLLPPLRDPLQQSLKLVPYASEQCTGRVAFKLFDYCDDAAAGLPRQFELKRQMFEWLGGKATVMESFCA
eukprot:TRINITY_DN2957_c0_g1_i1.p1 TRINITY_DN2957_c0_g1~~TRINITY_DN2957_c0_g1_i1.p1  ORF type:complete len:188 (+),score=49.09 TRINITY_DN2957_c0_g1_i1:47-565(+)